MTNSLPTAFIIKETNREMLRKIKRIEPVCLYGFIYQFLLAKRYDFISDSSCLQSPSVLDRSVRPVAIACYVAHWITVSQLQRVTGSGRGGGLAQTLHVLDLLVDFCRTTERFLRFNHSLSRDVVAKGRCTIGVFRGRQRGISSCSRCDAFNGPCYTNARVRR